MSKRGRICRVGGGGSAHGWAEEVLAAFAAVQRGVVSRSQLLDAGVGADQVDARIGTSLHPVHSGVYLVGHAARVRGATEQAALLAVPGSALAGRTAAAWHGLVVWSGRVELITASRRPVSRPGIHVHRSTTLRPEDVVTVDGLACTSVQRTACDLAAWHPRVLDRALNEAERQLLHTGDLLGAMRGRPGGHRMEAALARLRPPGLQDLRSRTEARVVDALLARRPALPHPVANVLVHGHLVDLWWEAQGLVVEVDGPDHHRPSRRAADLRRDADLRAHGLAVLRVPYERVDDDLGAAVEDVAAALAARERRGSG